jgi:hypothetical protein
MKHLKCLWKLPITVFFTIPWLLFMFLMIWVGVLAALVVAIFSASGCVDWDDRTAFEVCIDLPDVLLNWWRHV